MTSAIPHPESVRLALPHEASEIAGVQYDWLLSQPDLIGVLENLSLDQMVNAWELALVKPPLATYRVLVAVDQDNNVIGFAAIGPSEDKDARLTDGTVAEFCIHPKHQNSGHEDRLMHAVADTLVADGFTRAQWWIRTTDDKLRALLLASGWEADGAHREIGDEHDMMRVKQIRMHTSLVDETT